MSSNKKTTISTKVVSVAITAGLAVGGVSSPALAYASEDVSGYGGAAFDEGKYSLVDTLLMKSVASTYEEAIEILALANQALGAAQANLSQATLERDEAAGVLASGEQAIAGALAAEAAAKDSADAAYSGALNSATEEADAALLTYKEKLAAAEEALAQQKQKEQDLEKALAEQEEAQQALDALLEQSAYSEEEYLAAQEALAGAEAALSAAELEYEQASELLGNYSSAFNAATEAFAAAGQALAEAQAQLAGAATKVEEAEENLGAAQAAYDAVLLDSSNSAELQAAQAAYEAAQAELASALEAQTASEEAVSQAQGNLSVCQDNLATAEADLASKQEAAAGYEAAAAEKLAALAAAQEKHEEALTDLAAKESSLSGLQAEVSAASEAKDSADDAVLATEEELADLAAEISLLEKDVTDCQQAITDAQSAVTQGSLAYYKHIMSELEKTGNTSSALYASAKDAVTRLNSNNFSSYTNIGNAADATSLANMLAALDWIDYCNNLRAQHGLNPLLVSSSQMAVAQISTNAGTIMFAHSGYAGWENLAWGGSNPFGGWYTQEKALYDAGERDFQEVGHYLNIIDPNARSTGFAVTQYQVKYQGFTMRTSFGQSFSSSTSGCVTVAEYRTQLLSYYNNLVTQPGADLEAANAALAAAQGEQTALNKTYAQQVQAAEAAAETLANKTTAYETASGALQGLRDALSSASAAVSQAEENHNAAVQLSRTAQEAVTGAQENVAALTQEQTNLATVLEGALAAEQSAKETVAAKQGTVASALAERDAIAGDTLGAAAKRVSACEEALKTAEEAHANALAQNQAQQSLLEEKDQALQAAEQTRNEQQILVNEKSERVDTLTAELLASKATNNPIIESWNINLEAQDTLSTKTAAAVVALDEKLAAEAQVNAANQAITEAEQALATAEEKLAEAQKRSDEYALLSTQNSLDFSYLDSYTEALKEARATLERLQNEQLGHIALFNEKSAAFELAQQAYLDALMDQALAQEQHDRLKPLPATNAEEPALVAGAQSTQAGQGLPVTGDSAAGAVAAALVAAAGAGALVAARRKNNSQQDV